MVTAVKVKPFREVSSDGKLVVNFHTGQTRAWLSKKRIVDMQAGSQGGKTVFGPHWLDREIREKGPGDYLVGTSSFPLLDRKLLPEFLYVFQDLFHYGSYDQSRKIFTFWTKKAVKKKTDYIMFPDSDIPTRVIIGSAQNPESMESATIKGVWLDECVAPETLISTEIGQIPIQEIVEKRLNLRVWSYDTLLDKWELKPIIRWIRLPQRKPLLNLGDLRLTGNHKVWTKEGYILTDELITSTRYDILRVEVIKDSDRSGESCQSSQAGMVCSQWVDISSLLKSYGGSLDGRLSSDGFVYNLEVEGNHNYIADNILVSNCGQKQFKRETWEAVQRRTLINKARILMTTTLYGLGWLKTDIYDEWVRGNPDIDVIQFDSTANPAFPIEEYHRMQNIMPAWKFDMFHRGMFSKPAGLIYDSFDSVNDVVEPFEIPATWPRYVGHDFGPVHTVALWKAYDPSTGIFYTYRDYSVGQLSTFEHVTNWLELSKGERIANRYGGSPTEEGWRGDFTQAGWKIEKPLDGNVWSQINRVYGFEKLHKHKVFRTCQNYLSEKQTFSRELNSNFEPIENKIEDESVFHFMSAERYLMTQFRPLSVISELNGDMIPVTYFG